MRSMLKALALQTILSKLQGILMMIMIVLIFLLLLYFPILFQLLTLINIKLVILPNCPYLIHHIHFGSQIWHIYTRAHK